MSAVFTPTRYRLSVEDYHKLGEVGILTEDCRVELIEGELIELAPVGAQHVNLVNRLTKIFVLAVGDLGVVSIQNPVTLPPHSEPQPDIAVLKPSIDSIAPALPRAEDVLLLIEIADTTLAYDRTTKLRIYAQAGIVEMWIVNVQAKVIETYQEPSANGYLRKHEFGLPDAVTPLALPKVSVAVGDIFR
jgi:Uma2 family endonuclease